MSEITITPGTTISVHDTHGDDWFPLYIQSDLHQTTLYFRRVQLVALQERLDEILGSKP